MTPSRELQRCLMRWFLRYRCFIASRAALLIASHGGTLQFVSCQRAIMPSVSAAADRQPRGLRDIWKAWQQKHEKVWDLRDKLEKRKKKTSKSRRLQLSCTTHPVGCVGIYRRVSAKTPTMLSFMKNTVSNKQGRKKPTTSAVIIISSWLSIMTLKAPWGTDLQIFSSHLRLQQSSFTWINFAIKSS